MFLAEDWRIDLRHFSVLVPSDQQNVARGPGVGEDCGSWRLRFCGFLGHGSLMVAKVCLAEESFCHKK